MHRIIIIFFLALCIPVSVLAGDAFSDKRKFYLHNGVDELGNFNWGHFLTCLQSVNFPNDKGPRELNLATSRLVSTQINNKLWVFSVRENNSEVTLESIIIGTLNVYSLQDKRRLFLRLVGNCQLDENTSIN